MTGPPEEECDDRGDRRSRCRGCRGPRDAGAPPPHVRGDQPPGRRQVHAHRGAGPARRGDLGGRGRARQGRPARRHVRLDGHGARAGHLGDLGGAPVRLPRPGDQPPRHPGPRRLLRGHLPRARRRRRRGDAPRRRQGPRAADPQALRRLPRPRRARADVRQQVGPPGPRAARAARRGGADDRPAPHADHLAGRDRRRPARAGRARRRHDAPLHARRARRVEGDRRGPRRRHRRGRGGRGLGARHRGARAARRDRRRVRPRGRSTPAPRRR